MIWQTVQITLTVVATLFALKVLMVTIGAAGLQLGRARARKAREERLRKRRENQGE